MRRLVGTLGMLVFVALGAYGAVRVWNMAGSTYDALTFPAHVAPGVTPHLKASDAYRITLDYLTRADASAEPGTAVAPSLTSIWAVTADQAAALDGCIPTGKGSGVVWVTKGQGTYVNLASHPWPPTTESGACSGTGPAGTVVIDDATGLILGVYPYAGPSFPHPSPQVTLAPASASPLPLVSSPASPAASSSPGSSRSPSSPPGSSPSVKPSASGG
jgi:hypothetical protein